MPISKRQANWNGKIKAKTPVKYISDYFSISIETATIIKMICTANSLGFILRIINKSRLDYGSSYEVISSIQMDAISHMFKSGSFGVEAIIIPGQWIDSYWMDNCGLYVNVGDTYLRTIVFDTDRKEFICTSWGDFYETLESRLKIR